MGHPLLVHFIHIIKVNNWQVFFNKNCFLCQNSSLDVILEISNMVLKYTYIVYVYVTKNMDNSGIL
jgi:hypothetical protein